MAEDNKALSRRLFEQGWNAGKADLIGELNAPEAMITDPYNPIETKGPEGAKQYYALYKKALPDLHFTIDEQVAEGDTVVNFLTATATHDGVLLGLPPTHKKATVKAIVALRFKNGKIVSSTSMWDALDFMRKVGVTEMKGTEAGAMRR